jgi:hypothetical protein
MRFRIDNNFRLGGRGQRHTHSGCAWRQRIGIELPVKRIGNLMFCGAGERWTLVFLRRCFVIRPATTPVNAQLSKSCRYGKDFTVVDKKNKPQIAP